MKPTLPHAVAFACAFILHPSSFILAQGSLTPPGAPAATMKTLDQLEPRTPISALPYSIAVPGSYYLTGNLTGAANQHGITIKASDVTLDLMGFTLTGSGIGVNGAIRLQNGYVNATIRNGTVRGWLGTGVFADNFTNTGMRVENVSAIGCGSGIVTGSHGTVAHCHAADNAGTGIAVSEFCQVLACTAVGQTGASGHGITGGVKTVFTDCVATDNAGIGIQCNGIGAIAGCVAAENASHGFSFGSRSVIERCTATSNGGNGFSGANAGGVRDSASSNNGGAGFSVQDGASFTGCHAQSNGTYGLRINSTGAVQGCTTLSNTLGGILADSGTTLRDCASRADHGLAGLSVGDGSTVAGCSVADHSGGGPTSAGIAATAGCTIVDCAVSSSTTTAAPATATTGMGVSIGTGTTIERCTVRNCAGDGIRASSNDRVIGNTCHGNGNAGNGSAIHVDGSANRVEDNQGTGSPAGLRVAAPGNVIVRNTARSNTTNFSILAGNQYGPIIDLTAGGGAAVSGNSAPGVLTSADPWANFAY